MNALLRHNLWWVLALAVAAVLLGGAALFAFEPWNGNAQPPATPSRAALQDYSWSELAAIADEIGRCEDESAAIAKASSYGLCDGNGTIGTRERTIELADGTSVRVMLADIWHDGRTDGGKAGLTFAFADAAGEHSMNHDFEDARGRNADSVGGWESSGMRAWLNGTFFYALPEDLRDQIASVQKQTANTVDSRDELDQAGRLAGSAADWVGQTSDKLWLFSAVEICGKVPAREDLDVDATMSAIYAGEGSQYRLFAEVGAAAFKPNGALVRHVDNGSADEETPTTTWWLRTKTLEFGDGFWLVGTDGTPLNGFGEDARVVKDPSYAPKQLWGPDHARGVVVGFCL